MSRVFTLFCVFLASTPVLAGQPIDAARTKFFEERIRPILAESCFSCHGPEKRKGGLRLDSHAALLKGGDSGAAVVPGDTSEGLLLEAVGYTGDFKMPPKGKLSERQIADLKAWVKLGAPWPETPTGTKPVLEEDTSSSSSIASAKDHWAFRPISNPKPPTPRNAKWVRTPIDQFVLNGLEAAGLQPAPVANRRTLIRRAYFDLIGLPPAPEDVTAFVGDSSSDSAAFDKVIDRLLASPQYGERWGRHWLDVARYADSNGMDENLSHANAWRYRDWVIEAFNADLPYDQFIRKQIGGDLLAPQSPESVIPTGFLVIGPKMLAEDDPVKMHMDIVDEQLDTLGQAFLGMTLGCARCHDHKFDPIRTRDYYALAGILKSTKTMDSFTVVAKWQERSLANAAEREQAREFEARVEKLKSEIAAVDSRKAEAHTTPRQRTAGSLATAADMQTAKTAQRKQLQERLAVLEKSRPTLPSAMAVSEGNPANLRVHIRGNHLTLGKEVARGFPAVFALPGQPTINSTSSGRRELAEWITRPDHPLTARVAVNRIWTWHFGDGLVRTPDNFGRLGDTPVHGQLLDWLSSRFIQEKWSVKKLHRLIMSSATYQMSTRYNAAAHLKDPENRWLWRWDRQRLDAESIRDALLTFAGVLESSRGGSLLTIPNRKYVTSTSNEGYAGYKSNRRSIYLPVVRSAGYEPFQSFDFPDSSVPKGRRTVTTIPAQSLVLMNSDLVELQTRRMAARLLALPGDTATRLQQAWQLVFGRQATTVETDRAREFLQQYEAAATEEKLPSAEIRLRAYQGLCRSLISSNEFVYVE